MLCSEDGLFGRRVRFVRFLMSRLTLKSAIFSDGFIQLSIGDLPVTIGRSHRADIAINDLLLSRIHAEIRVSDNGEFELVDNESTNLTIVNEQDIDRVILKTGDKILLGDTELIVEIEMDQSNLHERTTREIPSFKPPEP
jgi:pSer/pThr/pTyr-binding forkhead associated (FHA) protein